MSENEIIHSVLINSTDWDNLQTDIGDWLYGRDIEIVSMLPLSWKGNTHGVIIFYKDREGEEK